eukprot:2091156-Amphidinium_carterae.1
MLLAVVVGYIYVVLATMSTSPTGTHAKSVGAVTETIDMETILREISRTLQALSGQMARLEHLHSREITAGMQALSHQIARLVYMTALTV